MDLSEINWDFNAAGSWPLKIKIAVILIVCCLVAGAGFYLITMDQLTELEALETQEGDLIKTFEDKQRKAVNLADYRAQFDQIKKSLADMMKQMPAKAEVPSLLTEISQSAVTSRLESKLFQPENIESKEFYMELPYSIEVVGKYEDLGLFVSGLASLPRIVTVHDIDLSSVSGTSENKTENKLMLMKATIKTYTEMASEDAENGQGGSK